MEPLGTGLGGYDQDILYACIEFSKNGPNIFLKERKAKGVKKVENN